MSVFNFSPFPVQVTEDLLLRQVSENDAAQLLELRSNEQVNRYVERKKATSIEDALAFIDIINK
jgi:ribosomal-protein-alanine N-acetyltransferase